MIKKFVCKEGLKDVSIELENATVRGRVQVRQAVEQQACK